MAIPVQNPPRDDGFEVIVERSIGRVSLGGGDFKSPFHAAMDLIASNSENGTYRFPGPHEDSTVIITVEGL